MNGVHDMGGMHGFGEVTVEADEPVFHAPWEGRVFALHNLMRGPWYHTDEHRAAQERLPAARYLGASYYERWLAATEALLVARGVITPEELRSGHASAPSPDRPPRPAADRPPLAPRFRPGDAVATRNTHPAGHTRLPRYARGRSGVVRSIHGPFLLPDTNATRSSRDWEPVYAVEFAATGLWGEDGRPGDVVCIDLWESYLE